MLSSISNGSRNRDWKPFQFRHSRPIALAASLGAVALLFACSREPRATAASSAAKERTVSTATGSQLNPTDLLENGFRAIEDGERESPRDRWDVGYVVNQAGSQPEQLFRWVRTNTYWIPYRGVLRGPAGVLMDRQGNTLDRALLLATLLQKAGHSVRLAHGELTTAQARALLPEVIAERFVAGQLRSSAAAGGAPGSVPRGLEGELATVARQYRLDEATLRRMLRSQVENDRRLATSVNTRTAEQTNRLKSTIGMRPSDRDWHRRLQAALAALRDHWWVQRKEGAKWIDLDVFADRETSQKVLTTAQEFVAPDAIAGNLRHEIVVRVVGEQSTERARTKRIVLQHTLKPADLIGTPIALRFVPAGLQAILAAGPGMTASFRKVVLEQHNWAPVLQIGQETFAQSILNDDGDGHPPGNARSPGELGAGLAGGIAGVLEGLDADSPTPPNTTGKKLLTAVWLEFEVHVPGEAPRTIRRTVFDLLGPAARASAAIRKIELDEQQRLARSLALMMDTEILPVVSSFAPEFVTHLWAQAFLRNRDLIRQAVNGSLAGVFKKPETVTPAVPFPGILYALACTRFEDARIGNRVYLDRPNIFTRHILLSPQQNNVMLRDAIDIVSNEIGVDLIETDGFTARLEQGVADTYAEALLRTGTVRNVANAYAASPTGWLMVEPNQADQLSSLALSEDTRRRMKDDLENGYAVIAPKDPVMLGSDEFIGWWRVDRTSGHALGIDSDGWGGGQIMDQLLQYKNELDQAMVQYHAQIQIATHFTLGFLSAWYYCDSSFATGCLPSAVLGGVLDVGMANGFGRGFWRGMRELHQDTRGGFGAGRGGKGDTLPLGTRPLDLSKTQTDPVKSLELGKTQPGTSQSAPSPKEMEALGRTALKATGEWIRYRALGRDNDPSWDPIVDAALKDKCDQANAEFEAAIVRQRDGPAPDANPCPEAPCASPLAKSIGGMDAVQDLASKSVKP